MFNVAESFVNLLTRDDLKLDNSGIGIDISGNYGVLIFKISKMNKYGIKQNRLLQIDLKNSTFRLLSTEIEIKKDFKINSITNIEKSSIEPERCILMFMGDVSKPYDLSFVNNDARENFIELFISLNPNIIVKDSAIQKLPNWVNDADALECMQCEYPFNIIKRRHHCRQCGAVVCATCSSKTAVLPHLGYEERVRVCDSCFSAICDTRVIENMMNTDVHSPSHRSTPAYSKSIIKSMPLASSVKKKSSNNEKGETDNYVIVDDSCKRDNYGFLIDNKKQSIINQVLVVNDDASEVKLSIESDEIAQDDSNSINLAYDKEQEKQRDKWNNFLANHVKITEMKDLVRGGIPPELRGRIWVILSGSKEKQSNEKPNYYQHLLLMAELNPTQAVTEIEKDLHRTFPNNAVFETTEGIASLRRVLVAYSVRNPTVGYCQSMNFICALLLLFLDEEDAFWLLTVMVEDLTKIPDSDDSPVYSSKVPLNIDSGQHLKGVFYYQNDLAGSTIDQYVFKDLVSDYCPKIFAQLEKCGLPLEPLTINWFLCLFINSLPLETTLRIWDIMFFDGVKILFRTGLTLLKLHEKVILKSTSIEQLMGIFKEMSFAATDCSQFINVLYYNIFPLNLKHCYDRMWIGNFSMRRICELRNKHRIETTARNQLYKESRSALSPAVFSTPISPIRNFAQEHLDVALTGHKEFTDEHKDVKLIAKFDDAFKSPEIIACRTEHRESKTGSYSTTSLTGSYGFVNQETIKNPIDWPLLPPPKENKNRHSNTDSDFSVLSETKKFEIFRSTGVKDVKSLAENFSSPLNFTSPSIDPKFQSRANVLSFYLGHMRPSPIENYIEPPKFTSKQRLSLPSAATVKTTPPKSGIKSPIIDMIKLTPSSVKEESDNEIEAESGDFVKIEFTDFSTKKPVKYIASKFERSDSSSSSNMTPVPKINSLLAKFEAATPINNNIIKPHIFTPQLSKTIITPDTPDISNMIPFDVSQSQPSPFANSPLPVNSPVGDDKSFIRADLRFRTPEVSYPNIPQYHTTLQSPPSITPVTKNKSGRLSGVGYGKPPINKISTPIRIDAKTFDSSTGSIVVSSSTPSKWSSSSTNLNKSTPNKLAKTVSVRGLIANIEKPKS